MQLQKEKKVHARGISARDKERYTSDEIRAMYHLPPYEQALAGLTRRGVIKRHIMKGGKRLYGIIHPPVK